VKSFEQSNNVRCLCPQILNKIVFVSISFYGYFTLSEGDSLASVIIICHRNVVAISGYAAVGRKQYCHRPESRCQMLPSMQWGVVFFGLIQLDR
jgi:hypothetical protein